MPIPVPSMASLEGAAKAIGESIGKAADGLYAFADLLHKAFGEPIKKAMLAIGAIAVKTGDILTTAWQAVGNIASGAMNKLGKATEWLVDKMGSVGEIFAVVAFAVIDALKSVGEAFGNIADKYIKPLTRGFAKLFDVENTLKPLTTALAPFAKAVGQAVGGLASAAGGALQMVVGLGQQLSGMVGLANPAALNMFNRALEDIQGVIGQALVPIFNLFTEIIRAAGDSLTTFANVIGVAAAQILKPVVEILKVLFEVVGQIGQVIGKVMEAAAPALAAVGQAILAIMAALKPVIDLLIDVLGGALIVAFEVLAGLILMVTPLVVSLAEAIGSLIKWISDGVRDLLAFVGISLDASGPGTAPGSSVGKAVKSTSIGSVESVLSKAQTSAYSLGSGASDPAATTAAKTSTIVTLLESLPKRLWDFIKDIPQMVYDLLKNIGSAAADTAKRWGGEAWDATGGRVVRAAEDVGDAITDAAGAAYRFVKFW